MTIWRRILINAFGLYPRCAVCDRQIDPDSKNHNGVNDDGIWFCAKCYDGEDEW